MNLTHTYEADSNYAAVLAATKELHSQLTDAFKRGDWPATHEIAAAIGQLYAPNDKVVANYISYLVDTSFTRGWFDSREDQATKIFRGEVHA
jgi:hypothetical protein